MLTPKSESTGGGSDDTMVEVVAEPLPEASDTQVLDQLADLGGEMIDQLAPGYITARIGKSRIEALQAVATVTIKFRYQTR